MTSTAPVAQPVEQRPRKTPRGGSNPSGGSIEYPKRDVQLRPALLPTGGALLVAGAHVPPQPVREVPGRQWGRPGQSINGRAARKADVQAITRGTKEIPCGAESVLAGRLDPFAARVAPGPCLPIDGPAELPAYAAHGLSETSGKVIRVAEDDGSTGHPAHSNCSGLPINACGHDLREPDLFCPWCAWRWSSLGTPAPNTAAEAPAVNLALARGPWAPGSRPSEIRMTANCASTS